MRVAVLTDQRSTGKRKQPIQTLYGGSLGSWIDEERSQLCEIVWTAGHMNIDILNAYCGPRFKLSMIILNNYSSVPGPHMVECRKYKLYQLYVYHTLVEILSSAPMLGKFPKLYRSLIFTTRPNRFICIYRNRDYARVDSPFMCIYALIKSCLQHVHQTLCKTLHALSSHVTI